MTFKIEEYCLENEIWKPIPVYENVYEASSLGRIRTIDGKVTHSIRHGVRRWNGRILKNKTKVVNPQMGYRVTLWLNKKPKDWLVARLVALAFYGIPNGYTIKGTGQRMTVNHIDGNRLNNKVENIEWCTLKENIQHAFHTGLMPTQHKIALIDSEDNYKEFRSKVQAGLFLGRSHTYIHLKLKKGKQTATDLEGNTYKIVEVK
jgi:hypothetical protein